MRSMLNNQAIRRLCFVAYGLLAVGAAGCAPPPAPEPNPCAAILCSADKVCEVKDVVCVREPCPPVAQCVPKPVPSACAAVLCPVNTMCVVQDVVCIRAPCPPVVQCVPIETN